MKSKVACVLCNQLKYGQLLKAKKIVDITMIYLRQLMSELISHIDYSNEFKAYPYKIDTILEILS